MDFVYDYLPQLVFLAPALIVITIGLIECWEEFQFKKNALYTIGIVTGKLPAVHPSRYVEIDDAGGYMSRATNAGHFLIVKYEIANGTVYQKRTAKSYKQSPSEVPVFYTIDDPQEVMIDGFYKVGNGKFYRIFGGIAYLLFFSWVFLIF